MDIRTYGLLTRDPRV